MLLIDWIIDFIEKHAFILRLVWNKKTHSFCMACLQRMPICPQRVFLVSRDGDFYSCNPKALADYLSQTTEWDVSIGLHQPEKHVVESRIRILTIGSFRYYYYLFTLRFL